MAPCTAAQQSSASGEPLSVRTTTLPKAYVGREYRFPLQAQGGTMPLQWQLARGSLPKGLNLNADGVFSGVATESGEFHFVVTVSDSGSPAHQRNRELVLHVVAPLLAQWSRYPKVVGQRVEGAVKVSNQTEQDLDLTAIVLAVNETGRATALGYQHFTLKKNTADVDIPFGDNLSQGAYTVNVDVVGEAPATNTIRRTRLVTGEKLQVQTEP